MESLTGDQDADDVLNAADADMFAGRSRGDCLVTSLPMTTFDRNHEEGVTLEDFRVWVKDLKHTWLGDANADGDF